MRSSLAAPSRGRSLSISVVQSLTIRAGRVLHLKRHLTRLLHKVREVDCGIRAGSWHGLPDQRPDTLPIAVLHWAHSGLVHEEDHTPRAHHVLTSLFTSLCLFPI